MVAQFADHPASNALVVIPTFNERTNIALLLPRILQEAGVDVLVVDDNSPDGTARVVQDLIHDFPGRLFLIRRTRKLGLGTAYLAGFRWALARDYELICEMDADFSHNPALLPRLLSGAHEADLVLGSRYVPGGGTAHWSPLRRFISRAGSAYARAILDLPYHDLTGGFKCFHRQVLEAIDLDRVRASGYAFQIELTYRVHRAGFRVIEVPIVFEERRVGKSKMSPGIMAEALLRVWQLRIAGVAPDRPASERRPSLIERATRPH